MATKLLIWCSLVLGVASGCGGMKAEHASKTPSTYTSTRAAQPGAEPVTAYSGETNARAPSPASDSPSGYGGASTDMMPAPAAPPSAAEATTPAQRSEPRAQPTPQERPGLGTEWGETRFSRVRDVAFVRADEDRPFATSALHYNDRAGVEALANHHAAHASARLREVPTGDGAVTISIRGADGEPLEAIHVGERTFVVGHEGERYTIVLSNHTNHRFEAVSTVDGLDVINGKPGSMRSRGYLLMPFATLEIDGFRRSQDAVAAFRFAAVVDSYAAQTGSARNVGVIGVALFSERGDSFRTAFDQDLRMRDTASPFPAADPRFARPPRR